MDDLEEQFDTDEVCTHEKMIANEFGSECEDCGWSPEDEEEITD